MLQRDDYWGVIDPDPGRFDEFIEIEPELPVVRDHSGVMVTRSWSPAHDAWRFIGYCPGCLKESWWFATEGEAGAWASLHREAA